ncbi:tetratricopeptide repeat protein [Streptacidiphilus melanogenes]|uniref:tetratricopeptide repeat protein n=1 Tax=Streptacidiphilus melanogenes TaxID=411235 RepID=UPI000A61343F|nr:tetratricopeptide repeat protein [Streptacidiphilus melanogenes]
MADSGDLDGLHSCSVGGAERLDAEGEIAVARLAMDGGDLAHAATHVGNAIASAPQLPEAHEVLGELAARAGGAEAALALFPMDRPYIGAVAARANLLASCGQWNQAVRLLAEVVATEPGRPWSEVAWLSRRDLPDLVNPEVVAQSIGRIVGSGLPDPFPEVLRTSLRPFYDTVRAVTAACPQHAMLLSLASGLARRYGDHDESIAWARAAVAAEPTHISAVMLGYALRAAGRPDEAIAVWTDELARDPSDLSLHVDVAELYAATGRPALGLPWAEKAVAANAEDPLVVPALHGIRFAVDQDPVHLVALVDHLREHPDHDYAATVLAQHSRGRPWLAGVSPAREATANVLRQFLRSPDIRAHHRLSVAGSAVEAPSSVLTLLQCYPGAELEFRSVPEPDPRHPLRPVGTQVWNYLGTAAEPAVPAPPAEASEAVRTVAEHAWPSLPAAYDRAVRLAAVPITQLLGVLVHPPLPRNDERGQALAANAPDLWVRAVQAFACLGIAHHGTDTPWPESERRRVLSDLLVGPEDWVTEAAALALLAVAWSEPATREDIGRLLTARLTLAMEAFRTRPVEVLPTLCALVLACPWLDERDREPARLAAEAVRRSDETPASTDAEQRGRELVAAGKERAREKERSGEEAEPRRRGLFRRRRR